MTIRGSNYRFYPDSYYNFVHKETMTMIKKIIIALISLAVAGAAGYYLSGLVHDKAIQPDSLPDKVQSFIKTYFPDERIAFSKEDRDFLKITYEIILTDGTKMEFRRNGEWKEIDRHTTRLPDGILPKEITDKAAELYPEAVIIAAESDDRDIEVRLLSGMELKFDNNTNLIDIDR